MISDFEHVTIMVFGQKPDSPLLKALEYNAIFDIGAIMTLSDQALLRLQYMDDSSEPPTKTTLKEGYIGLIRCFIAFVHKKFAEGDTMHTDWPNKLVKSEFEGFRLFGFTSPS